MVPLPSWKNLIRSSLCISADDKELARPWLRTGEAGYWFSRSAWSLLVIVRWYQLARDKQAVNIWIPDYFCNTTLGPLRDAGINLVFYPVTSDMKLDITACEKLEKSETMDMLLLVHYFGQPMPTKNANKLAKRNGAWLIEDATHVLKPIAGVGQTGDCVLYSPHKMIPIPDGAILVVRGNGSARLGKDDAVLKELHSALDRVYRESSCTSKQLVIWVLKRVAQKMGIRGKITFTITHDVLEEVDDTVVSNCRTMSNFSKCMLFNIISTLDDVANKRCENFGFWKALFGRGLKSVSPIELSDDTVPYLSPFQINATSKLGVIESYLLDRQLPVSIWPDLPPEVLNDKAKHPVAIELRKRRLYFATHHSISEKVLCRLWKCQTSFGAASWSCKPLDRVVWDRVWVQCNQTNMLQSWEYGDAKQKTEGWAPQRFLISNEQSTPVALVQILVKSLPVLGGVARLNRGPLVLNTVDKSQSDNVKLMALSILKKLAREQRWWFLQVAPEINNTAHNKYSLLAIGYRKLDRIAWGSGLIDLGEKESDILMSFAGKWRNMMRKGIKLGVVSEHVNACDGVEHLLKNYAELQDSRGFSGISDSLIRALAKQEGDQWKFMMLVAKQHETNEDLGVLVSIRTGDTATYLIGYANEKGKKLQANSVLLWNAILQAKMDGCAWFDIGGLNEITPKGIASFKKGINAEPYKLIGEWRSA